MTEKNTERTVVTDRSGGTNFVPFIVGALVVAVVVLGWLFFGGQTPSGNGPADVNVQIDQPADSGGSAGGAAGGGGDAGGSAGGGAQGSGSQN